MIDSPRDRCPACDSADLTAVFTRAEWSAADPKARRDAAATIEADPELAFDAFLRCDRCGTLFADRVPSPDALDRFYGAYSGTARSVAKIRSKLGLETRRLFCLKLMVHGRRFLDVGSSIGCAVEAARRNGFVATGIEPGEDPVEIARRHFPCNEFFVGTLDELPHRRQFDLVQCVEVLEHVPDPQRLIAQLAAAVAPGGVLFLTSPDAGHRQVRGDPLRWEMVCPPEHLTLFTRAGVRAALAPHFRRVVILPNAKPGVRALAFKGKS